MSRQRRHINDDGTIWCKECDRDVFIGDYYTVELLGDGLDRIEDIWYEKAGVYYGRPYAYCKECSRARARGPVAVQRYKARLELERRRQLEERDAAYQASLRLEFPELYAD